jgi:hypothetical protein
VENMAGVKQAADMTRWILGEIIVYITDTDIDLYI